MDDSNGCEVVEYTPFQEKLMAILREEYGNKNVVVDQTMLQIYNEGQVVKVSMGDSFAVLYATLTTKDGRIFTIPVGEISDYIAILTDLPWFQPSLYVTVSHVNYVPHYSLCIYSRDIENKSGILMLVENLCSMAGFSSDVLNDRIDRMSEEYVLTEAEIDGLLESQDNEDDGSDDSEESGESQ